MKAGIVCVTKFSRCLTWTRRPCSLSFVNFFAVSRNRFVFPGFSGISAPAGGTQPAIDQGLQVAPVMRNRLARMLRLQPGEMSDTICLVNYDTRWMGKPTLAASTPRGEVLPRGFPFFDFFRENFHR